MKTSKTTEITQYHLHKEHPEKLQFEVYDLKKYLKKYRSKAIIPHSHTYYQIIWVLKGDGEHLVDFKTYPIHKNTILFVGKNQIHAFDETETEGWLIHFNESFFMHTDVDAFLKHNIFKPQENPCYDAAGEVLSAANKYLELILEELRHRTRFGFEDSIRFLLKGLLIKLEGVHRKGDTEKLAFNNQQELQLFRFNELVDAHYKAQLGVADYAKKLHVSTKTLTTLTKKTTGKSPSQLIAERVLLEAKRLLQYTPLQVNEVAYRLGFDDASYFIKYFKRHQGVSPKVFRDHTANPSPTSD